MQWNQLPILSLLIALPLLGAGMLAFLPKEGKGLLWGMATAWGIVIFLVSLALPALMTHGLADLQLVENLSWVPSLGIRYHLGIDNLSLPLVLLTTLLTPLAIAGSWGSVAREDKGFLILLFVLESGLIGALCAADLVLFYVFWEVLLLPLYFLIGVWGGPRRAAAALRFFIFTLAGSLALLLSIVYLARQQLIFGGAPSTDLDALLLIGPSLPAGVQMLLFTGFVAAFAVKAPLWPLHAWQAETYAQSPTGVLVLLAGVTSKLGLYGMLRFAAPLFPAAMDAAAPVLAALAVVGVLYGALAATVQQDLKRLLAYASLSHSGMMFLGVAAFTTRSMAGSITLAVSHGLTMAGLALLAGYLQRRRRTTRIDAFGGLATSTPALAAWFLFFGLGFIGLPGLSGFVGEFFVLLGSFNSPSLPGATWLTAATVPSLALAAVYLLWPYQRMMLGPLAEDASRRVREDLHLREWLVLLPLGALALALGLAPGRFLASLEGPLDVLALRHEPPAITQPADPRDDPPPTQSGPQPEEEADP